MPKRKTKVKQKSTKKTKNKFVNKTHKNSDTKNALSSKAKTVPRPVVAKQDFIKKYPGFVIAIIFSIILIAIFLTPTTTIDPALEDKLYYAQQIHIENVLFVEDTQLAVEAELDGEYGDTLEDDYLVSILGDLDWFSNLENAIYNSKPTSDLFVKEIAVAAFRNRMIEINEQFTFEVLDFEPEYAISLALGKDPVQNFIAEEDLVEVFGGNEFDKKLFSDTLNKILSEYVKEKKRLINESSSQDRKYVEAKKLILLSY